MIVYAGLWKTAVEKDVSILSLMLRIFLLWGYVHNSKKERQVE